MFAIWNVNCFSLPDFCSGLIKLPLNDLQKPPPKKKNNKPCSIVERPFAHGAWSGLNWTENYAWLDKMRETNDWVYNQARSETYRRSEPIDNEIDSSTTEKEKVVGKEKGGRSRSSSWRRDKSLCWLPIERNNNNNSGEKWPVGKWSARLLLDLAAIVAASAMTLLLLLLLHYD